MTCVSIEKMTGLTCFMGKIEDRIKIAREYAKLSQAALAELLGISERTMQRYEKDASALNLETSAKIVGVCKVSSHWFLTGEGDLSNNDKTDVKRSETVIAFGPVVEDHIEVVKKFEDHETALLANEYLLNMEKKSSKEFHMAVGYLKGVSDSLDRQPHGQVDRRKKAMPFSTERRKTGS